MEDKKARALQMLAEGAAAATVARALGVPAATVRTWKNRAQKPGGVRQNVSPASKKVKLETRNETPATDEKLAAAVEQNAALTEAQKLFCLHYTKTFNATAAYRRAYPEASYDTARTNGSRMLANANICAEVRRLKKLRQMDMLAGPEDVVEKMMQMAFADITDFVEFGRAELPVMGAFGPVMVEVVDGEGNSTKVPLTKTVNEVRFLESGEVDGTLLAEVKQGKDGASVKLPDRMAALRFLADYFELHPADRHRRDYDRRRLALEEAKTGAEQPELGDVIVEIVAAQPVAEAKAEKAAEDAEDE